MKDIKTQLFDEEKNLQKVEVVNRIKIMIEGVRREIDDLKMWFTNH